MLPAYSFQGGGAHCIWIKTRILMMMSMRWSFNTCLLTSPISETIRILYTGKIKLGLRVLLGSSPKAKTIYNQNGRFVKKSFTPCIHKSTPDSFFVIVLNLRVLPEGTLSTSSSYWLLNFCVNRIYYKNPLIMHMNEAENMKLILCEI